MRRTDQMELGLKAKYVAGGAALRRQNRAQRAQWWFQQMRRVVQAAVDWPSTPAARPEQAYIKLEPNRSQS
jgi:hypothetical protein